MSRFSQAHIIKETHYGYTPVNIEDEMLAHREIECIGSIDADLVNGLINELLYLQKQDPDGEITMYINSPGGEVDSGMALYDVMKAVSCPIRTVCMGLAASMASLLFVSGDKRQMLPHSRVMIHDPLISHTGGSALKLKAISEDLMETRQIVANVIAEHSGKTMEEVYEKTASDSYFRAEQAVEFGLADEIITSI